MHPFVYILASRRLGTLYIGVTSDLPQRMAEHTQGLIEGFTKRYGVVVLAYHERFDDMSETMVGGKQLKSLQRQWTIRLSETMNPDWRNFFDQDTR